MSDTATALTPRQIELARHALGLDHKLDAYRNSFVANPKGADHKVWTEMVAAGDAYVDTTRRDQFSGCDVFWMSKSGAEKALRPGETLGDQRYPS